MKRAAARATKPRIGGKRAKHLLASLPAEPFAGKGAPFKDEDVPHLMREIDAILATKGRCSERDIDAFARANPGSTFARLLETDAEKALTKYRVIQIKNIVRCLRYRVNGGGVVVEPRIYAKVNASEADGVPGPAGPTYVHRTQVAANANFQQQLIDRALRELQAWQRRYELELRYRSAEFRFMYDSIRKFEGMLANGGKKQSGKGLH